MKLKHIVKGIVSMILVLQLNSLFGQLDSTYRMIKSYELNLTESSSIKIGGTFGKGFMFASINHYNIPGLQLCGTNKDTIINKRKILYMGEITSLDSNKYLITYRYRDTPRFYTDTCYMVVAPGNYCFAALPVSDYKSEDYIDDLFRGFYNVILPQFFLSSDDDPQTAYVCNLGNGKHVIFGE